MRLAITNADTSLVKQSSTGRTHLLSEAAHSTRNGRGSESPPYRRSSTIYTDIMRVATLTAGKSNDMRQIISSGTGYTNMVETAIISSMSAGSPIHADKTYNMNSTAEMNRHLAYRIRRTRNVHSASAKRRRRIVRAAISCARRAARTVSMLHQPAHKADGAHLARLT